jgi:branched-chain amino acid transport system substrate-binding protein
LSAAGVLCCLGLLATGCPQRASKVGVVLPLSGSSSTYGEAIRKGLELAYEELQADPDAGIPLEVSIVDTKSDAEKAKSLLHEQYQHGALIVIGGATSEEAKAMIPVAENDDRYLLSPSASSPELTGASTRFYRIFPSDSAAATMMAQFASQGLNATKVVVITEQQSYARGIHGVFQPAFEGYGGEVIEVIEVPPGRADLKGLMDGVFTFEPDAVYLAGSEVGIGSMIKELRWLEYKGNILTTSALALPSFIERLGEDAAGVLLTQTVFELDSDHAHIKKFVEGFEAKYGEKPDIYAAHGYDAMKLVASAMEDPAAVRGEVGKGLRHVKDFPGVTDIINFDENGDVQKYPRLYIIGDDLALYDYNERVGKRKEEMERQREELRRKLEQIQKQAKDISG